MNYDCPDCEAKSGTWHKADCIRRLTFDEVKQAARGQWEAILGSLGSAALRDALKVAPHHAPCPVHGGKDGFRFRNKDGQSWQDTGRAGCNTCGAFPDGIAVLAWDKSISAVETLYEVARYLRLRPSEAPRAPAAPQRPLEPAVPQVQEKQRNKLNRIWKESYPADHPLAEPMRLYLKNRGLDLAEIPAALRYHPALEYWVKCGTDAKGHPRYRLLGKPPAMVAMVSGPDGNPVTLHCTYIDKQGRKSPVPQVKKQLPSIYGDGGSIGGAIRLFEPGRILALTEGIENGLAVYLATGLPVWPCLNAVLLSLVVVPETVELVVVFGDLDRPTGPKQIKAGEDACQKLEKRLVDQKRSVEICLPSGPIPDGLDKIDWNDVYVAQGAAGFPQRWQKRTAAAA